MGLALMITLVIYIAIGVGAVMVVIALWRASIALQSIAASLREIAEK
jgi:hypothetical protein